MRLRRRLVKDTACSLPETSEPDPRVRIDWDVVRDAVGLEVHAVLEVATGVLVDWARDAVIGQVHV